MDEKKRIYMYPYLPEVKGSAENPYIADLIKVLDGHFTFVNTPGNKNLADMLRKLPKTDLIYFNWVEDLPHRKLAWLQIPLLTIILLLAKVSGKKVVWWMHNNISHNRRYWGIKKMIAWMMAKTADVIGCHTREIPAGRVRHKTIFFDHPMERYRQLAGTKAPVTDLLIWGTVAPYKGVTEFVTKAVSNDVLRRHSISIIGRFSSETQFANLQQIGTDNIRIENRKIPESELEQLFASSRYVLFTYNSNSVLGSAALCKSLSAGCTVIGPAIGAFSELERSRLLYCYESLDELPKLLTRLERSELYPIDQEQLAAYAAKHSWTQFGTFLATALKDRCWQPNAKLTEVASERKTSSMQATTSNLKKSAAANP